MNKKYTILYVDDEEVNLLLFKNIFKRCFNVITAIDGYTCLQKLKDNPQINALISDLKMPGLNGIDLIKLVKVKNPDLPCFILTGFDAAPEIAEALEKKLILKTFHKPFDNKEIEETLSSI